MEDIAAADHNAAMRNSHHHHHHHQEEVEEDVDTLSFCNLSINSSNPSSEWGNEDRSLSSSSSSSSSDQDCFEFYSEDWSTSSIIPHNYPLNQNIVFCGKIIPSKDLPVSNTPNNSPTHHQASKKRWKPKFFGKPRSKLGSDSSAKSLSMPTSGNYGVSGWGVSGSTSPAKSRWLNILMLGLQRLPEEMDLSDNKTKQQRRRGKAHLKKQDNSKALWGLLGVLGCGSHNHPRLHSRHHPCPAIEG